MLFNGVDMSQYFSINNIMGRGIAPSELSTVEVPGMDGAYLSGKRRPVRELELDITIKALNSSDLRTKLDEINNILNVDEPVPIIFEDEPTKTYYGIVESTSDSDEFVTYHQGSIVIICPDPYKYGTEIEVPFTTDNASIINNGTAEANPIFTLDVLQPVTFAIIQNQANDYMMIGKGGTVGNLEVSPKANLFEEEGATLASWQAATKIDNGTITGSFGTDGTGITVPNYGTAGTWHGPSLIKEIAPTQNFEVEAYLQAGTGNPSISFRVEVYLYDETMKEIGKMAIVDSTSGLSRIHAEGRLGAWQSVDSRYVVNSSNYSHSWDYFYGMMRMRRIGNVFNFYVTRVTTDNRHTYTLSRDFTDTANLFGGRLKYVQIHIGEYGDTPGVPSAKFFSVRAESVVFPTEYETPYVANTGDTIIFDHQTNEILINGESRMDLKDLGATFFPIYKGTNNLVAMPGNAFNIKVDYRQKYR